MILYHRRAKAFFITIKEGWSKKYITQNIASLSMMITSLSVFWFMLSISAEMKKVNIFQSYKLNPYISIYLGISCAALFFYSIFVFMKNIRKMKELCSVLVFLSIWNSTDQFFESVGGVILSPFTAMSSFFRQHLIKSKFGEVILSSLIWMTGEYIFKISIVVSVIFLSK